MKFNLEKAVDWQYKKEIEINTLEDLENIYNKYGHDLIVNFKYKTIMVYDGYIE